MARFQIPITPIGAYQSFSTRVSNRLLRFDIRWLALYEFFAVDIYEDDVAVTQGRGLHVGVNLLDGLNTTLGSIILEGDKPTLNNLGVANRLIYDDEGASNG